MYEKVLEAIRTHSRTQVLVTVRRSSADDEVFERVLAPHFLDEEAPALAKPKDAGRLRSRARYFKHLGIAIGQLDEGGFRRLLENTNLVEHIGAPAPLALLPPVAVRPAHVGPGPTWGIQALGIDRLPPQLTGAGVRIGHLDTGADSHHPALNGAFDAFVRVDGSGQVVPASAQDSGFHGTHTAATMVGRPVYGFRSGVAPGAKLCCAAVLEGDDNNTAVVAGLDWAIGRGVRIVNLSFGVAGWDPEFQPVIQRVRSAGVLPVVAVGNGGDGTSSSPGNYPTVVSVGAFQRSGDIPDFSASQNLGGGNPHVVPDLVGPGVDVVSARPGGGWQSLDGTSMAAPHIAGLAALLLQAAPQASIEDVVQALFQTCFLAPGMSDQRGNRGIPDALKALEWLQNNGQNVA